LAPQTEHFPSAVIFGCSLTSPPHKPHFKVLSPPIFQEIPKRYLVPNIQFIKILFKTLWLLIGYNKNGLCIIGGEFEIENRRKFWEGFEQSTAFLASSASLKVQDSSK